MGIQHKNLARRALQNMLGDDAIRARNAFAGMSVEQMRQQHGLSGKTRAEILTDYEDHEAKVKAALAWLEGVQP